MKKTVVLFIFFFSFTQATRGAPVRCQEIHAVPRLDVSADSEQSFYRNGYYFRLVRMEPSQKNMVAYQRAEKYIQTDFLKSLQTLGKSEAFIEMIESSNADLLKDSWVMMMYLTSDTIHPIGGAAFVVAQHPGQRLLMEKELQKNIFGEIIPTQYPISEVVRVGVDLGHVRSDTFPMLIQTITDVMRGNLAIHHFYGFTSLSHQKFYERLKHKTIKQADHSLIPELAEKDIIIESLR